MLRLHRTSDHDLTPAELKNSQEILAILKKYAPPSVVHFFAVPVAAQNNHIDWLSHHSGQVKPYQNLSATEQQALLARAQQHSKTVQLLQQSLEKEGKAAEAAQLTPLTVAATGEYLYAVDDKPVYTHWLRANPTIAAPIAAAAATTAVAASTQKRGCLWLLLLLLLLALLLSALAWWWFSKPATTAPIATMPATPAFGAKFACQADAMEPPEFTIIFDTSGSMGLNVNITKEEEDWYYSTDINTLEQLQKALRLEQGPSRFTVAKNAMQQMVRELHPQVPVQLLSFKTCGEVTNHGFFPVNRRTELLATLLNLETQGGTPSAQALFNAAQHMNGVDKEGIIILVIDGEDGCEANICQVADNIAQTKPRLRVNVVDVTGFGLSNCVAEKTGGRIYSSNNVDQITAMMRDSIEEVALNPNCSN